MGVVRRFPLHLFVIAASVGCVGQSMSQTGATAPTKAAGILKILGQAPAKFEALLGKPTKTLTTEDGVDFVYYKVAGTEGVRAILQVSQNQAMMGDVYVSFPKGTTWEKAAEAVGLKPASLKPRPLSNIPALKQLVGDPIKHWNVYFSEEGAKYSGANGTLINEDRGLPMIQFEQRSINDDSPD